MKRVFSLVSALFLIFLSSLYAAESPYVTGKFVSIEQKVHTKVLYYLVNTPITKDDPYFEIQVQVKDKFYTGEYAPRHAADLLPDAWQPEADVKVRLEKHTMSLKRPDGEDLEFVITRKKPAPADTPQAAPPPK